VTATIIAEALEVAEDAVPQSIGRRHDQYVIVDKDRDIDDSGWGLAMMLQEQHVSVRNPRVVYVRHDAMLAALKHLAERLERAEAQAAEMAEDAIREGWRACALLEAARAEEEAGFCYRDADYANEAGDVFRRDALCAEAADWCAEARRLRAYAEADAAKEAKP